MEPIKQLLQKSKSTLILTGAGISAESGIPTFRGEGGIWNKYRAQDLATPESFYKDPVLVWNFYDHRRSTVRNCKPNSGHYALSLFQRKQILLGRECNIITQNIDRLHQNSGAKNIVELHGSLWLVKPVGEKAFSESSENVWLNTDVPIVKGFSGQCIKYPPLDMSISQLPHFNGKLLRPAVVWFGESLDPNVLNRVTQLVNSCDLFILIGTSSVVYPAAGIAERIYRKGIPIVEINLEQTPSTPLCQYALHGTCGSILPELLGVYDEVKSILNEHNITV